MSDTQYDITGPIADVLLGGGTHPSVDARLEYMAGGGPGYPLVGQVNLSRACDDLSRDMGFEVYEAMLNDPTVASAFHVLATAALNGKFQVIPRHQLQPGQELASLPAAEREKIVLSAEIAAFIERQMSRLGRPIKGFLFEMMYGMVYGVKLAEKVFEEGDGEDAGRVCLKRLRTKRHNAWSYVITPYGDLVAIRGTIVGGTIVDFPPQKFVIFTWMPQDGDPRGRSLLRPAFNGWSLKVNSWPKLYKYLDRFGTPITVGTTAPDAQEEQDVDKAGRPIPGTSVPPTQALGNQLARMEGGSWIALRHGAEVNIFSPTGNGEAFLHAIQIFKKEILEGILMTARGLLEAEHGSKADTQEASHVVARLIVQARETSEGMMEHQVFHHLVELNYGKAIADTCNPFCSLGEVESKDIEAFITAMVAAGWVLDPKHFPFVDARAGFAPRTVKDGEPIRPPVEEPPPPVAPGQGKGASRAKV